MVKLNFEDFKSYAKKELLDQIDIKNGQMTIHKSNINKYLEKYMCKNEDDLSDTLYYNLGVWVKIID